MELGHQNALLKRDGLYRGHSKLNMYISSTTQGMILKGPKLGSGHPGFWNSVSGRHLTHTRGSVVYRKLASEYCPVSGVVCRIASGGDQRHLTQLQVIWILCQVAGTWTIIQEGLGHT